MSAQTTTYEKLCQFDRSTSTPDARIDPYGICHYGSQPVKFSIMSTSFRTKLLGRPSPEARRARRGPDLDADEHRGTPSPDSHIPICEILLTSPITIVEILVSPADSFAACPLAVENAEAAACV